MNRVSLPASPRADKGGRRRTRLACTNDHSRDWFETIISLLSESSHRSRHGIGAIERRQADPVLRETEEALRESEVRFRGTFENAAVGIAHVDAEGRFLLVNDKLCDIVGYTREELLVRGFQDITHPEDLAASLDHFRSLMRGELPSFSLEKRYLRKDGSVVWGNVSLSIQIRSAGEPAYGIAILQDISELKKVEDKLRRASEQLGTCGTQLEGRPRGNGPDSRPEPPC